MDLCPRLDINSQITLKETQVFSLFNIESIYTRLKQEVNNGIVDQLKQIKNIQIQFPAAI